MNTKKKEYKDGGSRDNTIKILSDFSRDGVKGFEYMPTHKIGLLDESLNVIVDPIYEEIDVASDRSGYRRFTVKNSNGYFMGLMNNNFEIELEPIYLKIGVPDLGGNRIVLNNTNKKGLIDKNFNVIIPAIYDNVEIDRGRFYTFTDYNSDNVINFDAATKSFENIK